MNSSTGPQETSEPPELSPQGSQTITLVVGAGGIGFHALTLTAALAVNRRAIAVIDPDVVTPGNWKRQWVGAKLPKALMFANGVSRARATQAKFTARWYSEIIDNACNIATVTCVEVLCWPDNDRCRLQVMDAIESRTPGDIERVTAIFGGNSHDAASAYAAVGEGRVAGGPILKPAKLHLLVDPRADIRRDLKLDAEIIRTESVLQGVRGTKNPAAAPCDAQSALANQKAAGMVFELLDYYRNWRAGDDCFQLFWYQDTGTQRRVKVDAIAKAPAKVKKDKKHPKGLTDKQAAKGAKKASPAVVEQADATLNSPDALLPSNVSRAIEEVGLG